MDTKVAIIREEKTFALEHAQAEQQYPNLSQLNYQGVRYKNFGQDVALEESHPEMVVMPGAGNLVGKAVQITPSTLFKVFGASASYHAGMQLVGNNGDASQLDLINVTVNAVLDTIDVLTPMKTGGIKTNNIIGKSNHVIEKISGKTHLDNPKQKVNTASIGDIVRTPTTHPDDFIKLKGNQGYKNVYTGEIWQKSDSEHADKIGEWKVGVGKDTPTRFRKITIGYSDGKIIKFDKK